MRFRNLRNNFPIKDQKKYKNYVVTGATGYIGKRLIPLLLNDGHTIVCPVRDKKRVESYYKNQENVTLIEADFLNKKTLNAIPKDIDAAYYLIHSMSNSAK